MGVATAIGAGLGIIGARSAKKSAQAQAQAVGAAGAQAAGATEYAADLQYKASQEALALSREQYENDMRMLMPYLQGGAESYGRAQALLAAGPPVVTYEGFASYTPTGGGYVAPSQMTVDEFTASPAPEDTAARIAELQGQIAQAQSQIDANQALAQQNYGYVQPQQQWQGIGKMPQPAYPGAQFFNQMATAVQNQNQIAQAQANLASATSELESLQAQEAQRVAKEQEAYEQSRRLAESYNRGLAAIGGPQAVEYTQSPGYQFRLDEGMKAIERGAAARGRVDSGETMKALQQYGQGLAAQDYEAFEQKQKADYYNYLAALSGQSGQSAAGQAAGLGASSAAGAANIIGRGAQALGQGYATAGQQRASAFANQAIGQSQANQQYQQSLLGGIGSIVGYGQEKGWFS